MREEIPDSDQNRIPPQVPAWVRLPGRMGNALVAIITVVEEEYDAVRERGGFNELVGDSPYLRRNEISPGVYDVILARSADRSNTPCSELVRNIAEYFRPEFIILSGIAGGVTGRDGIALGDVVVADHVDWYEMRKIAGGKDVIRKQAFDHSSMYLRDTITRRVKNTSRWLTRVGNDRPNDGQPKVLEGNLIAGDKILGDRENEYQRKKAKGCHDPGGPDKALTRGWTQAQRIDVMSKERKVTIKRIAIATRWGAATSGPAKTYLSVRDPLDEGEPIDAEDKDAVFIGLLRHHIANLVDPLGHAELANALRRLARERFQGGLQRDVVSARILLHAAPVREVEGTSTIDGLVGGIVTRAGPLTDVTADLADEDVLARLNLRPVFVGIERDLIEAAIEGEAKAIRDRLGTTKRDEVARSDRAGGWIIPLGGSRHIIGGA